METTAWLHRYSLPQSRSTKLGRLGVGRVCRQVGFFFPISNLTTQIHEHNQRTEANITLTRIATLYYLLGLFTTSDQTCHDFSAVARDTYMPCKRVLWESPDSTAWKTEYELGGSGELTILKIFELHRYAKMDVKGGVSEVLDKWYADVDGLGGLVLLSAAVGWMKDDGQIKAVE